MARRISSGRAAGARRIDVAFGDGSVRVVDLAPELFETLPDVSSLI